MLKAKNDPRTRCFIMRNGLVLAMVREFSKTNRTILLPGGGIDAGESSLYAVKREIKEELTLTVSSDPVYLCTHVEERDIFPDEKTYIKGYDKIKDIFDFYVYRLKPHEVIDIAQEEHEKWANWGFIKPHMFSEFAKTHKSNMGIGIESAAKILVNRLPYLS